MRRINTRALPSWRRTHKRWSKSSVAKTKTYCEIADLGEQIDAANQEQDADKAAELTQKINGLQKNLGPEFLALADDLKSVNPNSKDDQEISSILERLDDLCDD